MLDQFAILDATAQAELVRRGEIHPLELTGQPAISLPLHWNADHLPIGVQLVADYGREDLLIQVAAQLEEAQPWAAKLEQRILSL